MIDSRAHANPRAGRQSYYAHAMIASGRENAMKDGKIELYRTKLKLSFKFEGSI